MKPAVAFIIFRRPDTTAKVFARIRQYRPERLHIIADGPRPHIDGEADRVAAARAIVADDRIDWPCTVNRIYSEENLGCSSRVVSGLTEVFACEDSAIILEDDCLPHIDFFAYCSDLLEHFSGEERLGHVGGNNFIRKMPDLSESYFFSRQSHIWGWATWRRVWQPFADHYNFLDNLPDDFWTTRFASEAESNYWRRIVENAISGRFDSWDYRWHLYLRNYDFLSAYPGVNLVRNIGIGRYATNTGDGFSVSQKRLQSIIPIEHSRRLRILDELERHAFYDHFLTHEVGLISRLRIFGGRWRQSVCNWLKGSERVSGTFI